MIDKKDAFEQGKKLEAQKNILERKNQGIFYTPAGVVDYMASKALDAVDLISNPFVKIFDPACGAGFFLIKCFEKLKEKFERDYDEIIAHNEDMSSYFTRSTINKFIVENNLYGADMDARAVVLAQKTLMELASEPCGTNIICCDSLLTDNKDIISNDKYWEYEFDFVIGNPPYIGHKSVDGIYKKKLQKLYPGIYSDKADLSYCFFKKGMDSLKTGGTLLFITSRYFLEGPSAATLRGYIGENGSITEIVDFCGHRVFEDACVAVCIINILKDKKQGAARVLRFTGSSGLSGELFDAANFESFQVSRSSFQKQDWLLLPTEKDDIYHKVEQQGTHALEQLFESYQGIITGCDRAFVVTDEDIAVYNPEQELLKPWIKNSHVRKYFVQQTSLKLIYSDEIESEEAYPNAILYIERYKERLLGRRECLKGMRKWYQLQWGRKISIFESRRIVYPYKSGSSRFAIEDRGCCCSADVYSLVLKGAYTNSVSLEYVTVLLNSKLFEFYFKCFAKKLSDNFYDYYPNTVLRMKINIEQIDDRLQKVANEIYKYKNEEQNVGLMKEADEIIYDMYGINEKQKAIIENNIK